MSYDTVYRTMLYDYYSDFLTEKQKLYFDLHYNEDLSLAEISEQNGVSKQAVWDNIRHAEATLAQAEQKLALVKKSFEVKSLLSQAANILNGLKTSSAYEEEQKETALRLISQAEELY